MMDLRKRIYLIIAVVLGILIAILGAYYFLNKEKVEEIIPIEVSVPVETGVQTGNVPASVGTNNVSKSAVTKMPAVDPDELYAKQVSRIFVERFLSYSNQDNNQHITEILPMVADSMSGWVKEQLVVQGDEYSGITTKVIASQIEEIDEEKAIVLVDVQQTLDSNGGQKVEYKSGKVNLVRSGDDWLVSGLYWE
ncbi:MAG: hypothetical protein ABIJ23_03115 [Candidatus Magasanikbacteria bacterium]